MAVIFRPETQIAALKRRLAETDYKALKFAEGAIPAGEYEPVRLQRQAWRDEINEIEGGPGEKPENNAEVGE